MIEKDFGYVGTGVVIYTEFVVIGSDHGTFPDGWPKIPGPF